MELETEDIFTPSASGSVQSFFTADGEPELKRSQYHSSEEEEEGVKEDEENKELEETGGVLPPEDGIQTEEVDVTDAVLDTDPNVLTHHGELIAKQKM